MAKKKKNDIIEDEISTANILGIEPIQDDYEEEETQSNKEMVIEKALNHILSTEDMDIKANIKESQVMPYTRLMMLGNHYNIPGALKIADQALKLSVSIGGLSRKSMVDITRSIQPEFPEVESNGLQNLVFGKVHK